MKLFQEYIAPESKPFHLHAVYIQTVTSQQRETAVPWNERHYILRTGKSEISCE